MSGLKPGESQLAARWKPGAARRTGNEVAQSPSSHSGENTMETQKKNANKQRKSGT